MIGKILGNRYVLKELIGEGGMALVYKAECSLLNRTVAVKILRPQYAGDTEFVERFRREARSVASLSHPNIVSIYDVGEEFGCYYIVMEYVAGDTLKNIIKNEAPFSVKRSLDYTKQIAAALDHAHKHNIIHRDIKPHNILVTKDGRVKVTDFGIARAISESSFTQTGIVVGSVQYSSPEQVKGGAVGPQSDIYSLGCVLYEMLTGRVPFKGDTSISIAMQHLQEKMIPLSDIRNDVSETVEIILEKCLDKKLNQRYATAEELLNDLNSPEEGIAKRVQRDETDCFDDCSTKKWKAVASDEFDSGVGNTRFESTQTFAHIAVDETKSGFKKWLKPLAFLGGSLVLCLFILMLLLSGNGKEVVVPDLVGKTTEQAQELLNKENLLLKVTNQIYSSDYAENHIISQRPGSGNKKRPHTEVEVVVSLGKRLMEVPDLLGKTKMAAELELERVRLQLGEISYSVDFNLDPGTVIEQNPQQGAKVSDGTKVNLVLSTLTPTDTVIVPNFIGRSLSEVRAELDNCGLVFNQATMGSSEFYSAGTIIDQRPAPNAVVPGGTAINFIVSSGNK